MKKILLLLVVSLFVVHCASTTGGGTGGGSRYVITAEDIAKASAATAYEAVQLLRSEWLRVGGGSRGITTGGLASEEGEDVAFNVFVNGRLISDDPSGLESLSVDNIQTITYLRTAEAKMKFGARQGSAAVLVETQ